MTTRAGYRVFAEQGFLSGLAWGAAYVALSRYLAGEQRSIPEIFGLILGHGLIFLAIGLALAGAINWALQTIRAKAQR